MVRELIKDMEDIEGDIQSKCKSVPIEWGLKKTKWLVLVFILLALFYIHYILVSYFYTNKVIDFWYLSLMFSIPLAALSYLVFTASEKKDFYYASIFTKAIMIIGILTIIPLWYFFLK
jgi:4-hydroxybenzoate polyprenyltransferase